jgi:hypothetical protein
MSVHEFCENNTYIPLHILHNVHTGTGGHAAFYQTGTGGSFPLGKAAACEIGNPLPSSAEVKNIRSYNSTPHTPLWHA